jgi:hypothetical protein
MTTLAEYLAETSQLDAPADAGAGTALAPPPTATAPSALDRYLSKARGDEPQLNFMQRINQGPHLENPDGTVSSHRMSSAVLPDGTNIAYPEIIQDPATGEVRRLDRDAAYEYAVKTGQFKRFKDAATAEAFAEGGYKTTPAPRFGSTQPAFDRAEYMQELKVGRAEKTGQLAATTTYESAVAAMLKERRKKDPSYEVPEGADLIKMAATWAASVETPDLENATRDQWRQSQDEWKKRFADYTERYGGRSEEAVQRKMQRDAEKPEREDRVDAFRKAMARVGDAAWDAYSDEDKILAIQAELGDPSLMKARGAGEAYGDVLRDAGKLMPGIGALYEAAEWTALVKAGLAIDDGTATPDQYDLFMDFTDETEIARLRGDTVLGGAVSIGAMLPGFMIEFAATGGLYSAGKAIGKKVAERAIKRVLIKSLKHRAAFLGGKVARKYAPQIAGVATGALFRTGGMPQHFIKAVPEGMLYHGEGFWEALAKAGPRTYFTMLAESSGPGFGVIGKAATKSVRRARAIRSFRAGFNKWAKSKGIPSGRAGRKLLQGLAEKAGYHGVVPEILEEQLEGALGILTGDGRILTLQEIKSMAVALSIFGGSAKSLTSAHALNKKLKSRRAPSTKSFAAWSKDAKKAGYGQKLIDHTGEQVLKDPANSQALLENATAQYIAVTTFIEATKEAVDVEMVMTPEGEMAVKVKAKPPPEGETPQEKAIRETEELDEAPVSPEAETGGREEYPALVSEEQVAAELKEQEAERERASTGAAPVEAAPVEEPVEEESEEEEAAEEVDPVKAAQAPAKAAARKARQAGPAELKIGDVVRPAGQKAFASVVGIKQDPDGGTLYTVKSGNQEEVDLQRSELSTEAEAVAHDAAIDESRWQQEKAARVEEETAAATAKEEVAEGVVPIYDEPRVVTATLEDGSTVTATTVDSAKSREHQARQADGLGKFDVVVPDPSNPNIRAALELAKLFGEKGPDIVWVHGGNLIGMYDARKDGTGAIYMQINGGHGSGPIYSILAHELVHALEVNHPGTFKALKAAILANPDMYNEARKNYLLDAEAANPLRGALLGMPRNAHFLDSEGFARIVQAAVSSGNFLAQLKALSETDPEYKTLYEKVMDVLEAFIDILRTAPNKEARDYYRKVSQAFIDATEGGAKAKAARAKAERKAKIRTGKPKGTAAKVQAVKAAKSKPEGQPEPTAEELIAEYEREPEAEDAEHAFDEVDEANIASNKKEVEDPEMQVDADTKRLSDAAFNGPLTKEEREELGPVEEHIATLKANRGETTPEKAARQRAAYRILALYDGLLLKKAMDIVDRRPDLALDIVHAAARDKLYTELYEKYDLGKDKTAEQIAKDRAARKKYGYKEKVGRKRTLEWWIDGYKAKKGAPFSSYVVHIKSPPMKAMLALRDAERDESYDEAADVRPAKHRHKELIELEVARFIKTLPPDMPPAEKVEQITAHMTKYAEEELEIGVEGLHKLYEVGTRPKAKPHELDGIDPKVVQMIMKDAYLKKPGKRLGRPELAMGGGKFPLMQGVDAARKKAGVPKRESMDEWDEQGKQITDDPARKQELKDKVNRLEQLTKGEARAMVNTILPENNDKALADMLDGNMTPGVMSDEAILANNYRNVSSEVGRELKARQDPYQTPQQRLQRLSLGMRLKETIAGMTTKPPPNIITALEDAGLTDKYMPDRKLSKKERRAREALKAWHKDMRAMIAKWGADGITLSQLENLTTENMAMLRRVMTDMRWLAAIHTDEHLLDPYVEFLRISVLSGAITHIRNFAGNMVALEEIVVAQPLASALRWEGWRPTAKAWRYSILSPKIWKEMSSNAWFSWVYDAHNMFEVRHPGHFDLQQDGKDKGMGLEEQQLPKITGARTGRLATAIVRPLVGAVAGRKAGARAGRTAGRIASAPMRWFGRGGRALTFALVVAGDQIGTTMHANANVAGIAAVKAKEAGHKPGSMEYNKFIDTQVNNSTSESWQASAANRETAMAVFRDPPGKVEAWVQKWRRKVPIPGNWVAPFAKFPFKLLRRGAGHLPTAVIYIAYRLARAKLPASARLHKEYNGRTASHDVAKWVIGTGLYFWMSSLSDDEDKEGWRITGPPQLLPRKEGRYATEAEIVPPYGYRWSKDDEWKTYRNIDPLSSVIAASVTIADAIRDVSRGRMSKADAMLKAYSRFRVLIADTPTLVALKQFNRLFDNPEGYRLINFGAGVMNMHVPNLLRSSIASTDDVIRASKIRPGEDKLEAFLKLSLYNAPYAPKQMPKVGIFGDDVTPLAGTVATAVADAANWVTGTPIFDAVVLTRLLSPSRPYFTQSGARGDMLEMLMDWNIAHPTTGQAYWIAEPSDRVDVNMDGPYHNGPQVGLNNAEFYLLKKATGAILGNMVDRFTWPKVAEERHKNLVKKLVEQSRVRPLAIMKRAAQAKVDGNMDLYARHMAALHNIANQ